MATGTDWGSIITAIGGSTIGIISTITQHPVPAPQSTSLLDAAIGTDLRRQQETTGMLVLLGGGALLLYLLTRK